jgi:heme exporter protein C
MFQKRLFLPVAVLVAVMFADAPFMILAAPYESTMGLVQKIFYFHAPIGMVMFLSTFVCGISSIVYLVTRRRSADHVAIAAGELAAVLGVIVLVTGPLWARKAWGVWWSWEPRLTSSLVLWLIFVAYLLLRRYGGPGSDRLGAGVAIFGMANVPFVYWSVNVWRTLHPKTTVVPTLPPLMRGPFWFSVVAFLLLYILIVLIRAGLERRRDDLEALYLAAEDGVDHA